MGRVIDARLAPPGRGRGGVRRPGRGRRRSRRSRSTGGAARLGVRGRHRRRGGDLGCFDADEDRCGHLDVFVHTDGVDRPAAPADLDLADFDGIHRVNVRGTFVVDQQAARRLRDGGSIVNVSTSMARVAPPALSAYAASRPPSTCPPASWPRNCAAVISRSMRSRSVPPRPRRSWPAPRRTSRELPGERLWHGNGLAAGDGERQLGESVTRVQQGHEQAPHRYRVGQVPGGTVWSSATCRSAGLATWRYPAAESPSRISGPGSLSAPTSVVVPRVS